MAAVLLVTFSVWSSCRRESIRWDVDVAVPLLDDVVTWGDALEDSVLLPGTDGVAILAFKGPISSWSIESLTQLPDTLVSEDLTPDFVGGPFAVPPGAVLLDTEEDIVFQGIEQEFTYIRLESGRIEYSVESSTDGYIELQYAFPSVTVNEESVTLNVLLPPSISGEIQSEVGVIDLAGAEIDLTGISGTEINRIASQLTIGTPVDISDTAQVYGTDSIRVRMHFKDLIIRQVAGYFGQEFLDLDAEQTVFDSDIFVGGYIGLQPTRAMLSFHNTIGADLRLTLDALSVGGIPVGHPVMGLPQLVSRADWQGSQVVPAIWEVDLLAGFPDVFDLLGNLPESVFIQGNAVLNPLGDVSGGNDFFDAAYPPELNLDIEVPLNVQVNNLTLHQTMDVKSVGIPNFDGKVVLQVTNGFPIDLELVLLWYFNDPDISPVEIHGEVAAFETEAGSGPHVWESQILFTSEMLLTGGYLDVQGRMHADGMVVFSGQERLRVQAHLVGTHQVEIE